MVEFRRFHLGFTVDAALGRGEEPFAGLIYGGNKILLVVRGTFEENFLVSDGLGEISCCIVVCAAREIPRFDVWSYKEKENKRFDVYFRCS